MVEAPVGMLCLWATTRYGSWGRRSGESPAALWRMLLLVVGVSLITHPFAWWSNRGLAPMMPFATRAALIELAVVVVEAVLLRGGLLLRWRAALTTSLVMNMASFGYGLWLISRDP